MDKERKKVCFLEKILGRLQKIQKKVAEKTGKEIDEEEENRRAEMISRIFKNE